MYRVLCFRFAFLYKVYKIISFFTPPRTHHTRIVYFSGGLSMKGMLCQELEDFTAVAGEAPMVLKVI